MTLEEAQLYLPLEDLADLDDVYDDQLHRMFLFLLRTVPVTRLMKGRIELMRKIHRAYEFYAKEEINDHFDPIELIPYDAQNLFDLTVDYQRNLRLLRNQLSLAESFPAMIVVAEQLLQNMRDYAACWNMDHREIPEDIRIMHPEDEVELLIELERLTKVGELTMKDVFTLPLENLVRREAIRLSLWHKREINDRAI